MVTFGLGFQTPTPREILDYHSVVMRVLKHVIVVTTTTTTTTTAAAAATTTTTTTTTTVTSINISVVVIITCIITQLSGPENASLKLATQSLNRIRLKILFWLTIVNSLYNAYYYYYT